MRNACWMIRGSLVTLWLAAAAQAGSVQLVIDPSFGSTENTGSSALVTLDFSTLNTVDLMTVTIENTTPLDVNSWLSAVGLELPDSFGDSSSIELDTAGTYFDTLLFDQDFPPPSFNADGGYDVVFSGDQSFLGQTPSGAIMGNESDSFVISFGDTPLEPADFVSRSLEFYNDPGANLIVGRFQRVGSTGDDSDKVRGGLPEPATLVLLALGVGVLAAAGRRQKRHGRHARVLRS